jgi:phosphohistidine phosphatase
MDLILWRHAEAVDGAPDLARTLTAKGTKQAEAMARWLRRRLPEQTRVIVSPAKRALQTAEALTDNYEIVQDLAPGASPAAVLSAVGWPEQTGTVLVVGHQPALGMVASLVIADAPVPWSIKKGAIWWISRRVRSARPQAVLRAAISPEFL